MVHEGTDPRGRNYYWIGEQEASWQEDSGSDYTAIENGLVAITPLRSDMTDYQALSKLKDWADIA